MVVQQILDYVAALEEKGHSEAALVYLDNELSEVMHENYRAVNDSLKVLPVHLYSTKALLYTLTLTYYYKKSLPNRPEFFEAIYNEIVFVRGHKEAEEALLVLQ